MRQAPRLTTTCGLHPSTRCAARLLAGLFLLVSVLGGASPATAEPDEPVARPSIGHPWFGPNLDIKRDDPLTTR